MSNRLRRLTHDEAGMSYVFIGLGCMAFLSASMLAIDVGMLMTARNQAQNSADAGALAGATALLFDNYDDRSASGPAVTSAIAAATNNTVMSGTVSVTARRRDVPARSRGRGEPRPGRGPPHRRARQPVSTLIAQYFGMATADIGATATAEVSPANAMTCVKPFTIPDKWNEAQTPPWSGDDTYDAFDNKGRPLANPDIYIPANQPGYTGYNQESNRGQRLEIRAGNGSKITVSFYFSLAMGKPVDHRRRRVPREHRQLQHDDLPLGRSADPGARRDGRVRRSRASADLIARDPGAYWDTATNKVKGSAFGARSPRVFPIPALRPDRLRQRQTQRPRLPTWSRRTGSASSSRKSTGISIWGRIIPIAGIRDKTPARRRRA